MSIAVLLLAASANAAIVVDADGKPIRRPTMIASKRIAPHEAYRLVLGALDSLGLGGELFGKLLRVADAAEPYVTALVCWQDLSPEDQERLFAPQRGEGCGGDILAPRDTIVITDLRSNIERLLGRLTSIEK